MRIAYLMLVHRNPVLLQRVINALGGRDSAFFVHLDAKTDRRMFCAVSGDGVTFVEPRIPVFWGEFSQVEATLLLLRAALATAENFDYFVLLQGSDYPIRGRAHISAFLLAHTGEEFISAARIPAPGFPLSKVNKMRYPSHRPLVRFASRALAKFGLCHRDHRAHLGNMEPFAGDACWALSRQACDYIVRFVQSNPSFSDYFRLTFTSDEMFFHTILGNSPFVDNLRPSLLYRDWPEPSDHPRALTMDHIAFFRSTPVVSISDQFGSGERLFARKFSDERIELIDALDRIVMA